MATTVAKLKGVVVGEFGKQIVLTCKDRSGTAQNVSAYTGTKTVSFRSPKSNKEVTATLSFVTDGSDGKVSFAFASGDLTESGDWYGTVELKISTTTVARSDQFVMEVAPAT
jgi:hypothetical protein